MAIDNSDSGIEIQLKFHGVLENGTPVGSGTIDFPDSVATALPFKRYTGKFNDGKLFDGPGRLEYLDGRIFEGEFFNGSILSGKMIYPNGDTYEGQFHDGNRHGKGVFSKIISTGQGKIQTVFTGDWENNNLVYGKKENFLISFWEKQLVGVFEGEFLKDDKGSFVPTGKGSRYYPQYSAYTETTDPEIINALKEKIDPKCIRFFENLNGSFDGNMLNGKLLVVSHDQSRFYIGDFLNDKLDGKAVQFYLDSNTNQYKLEKIVYKNNTSESNTLDLETSDTNKEVDNVVIQTAQTFYQGEGTLLKDSDGSLTTMFHGKGCLRHKKTQTKKSGNFYYGDFNSGEISFKNGLNVFIEVQHVSERKITFSKGDLTFSLILEYKDLVKLNDKLDQLELLNFDETIGKDFDEKLIKKMFDLS